MNTKKTILASSVAIIISSFNAPAFDYVVKGQVEGMDGQYLYMKDYDTQSTIDTALISNGHFKFEGSYERPAFVRIDNLEQLYSNCVLDSLVVLDFETHWPSEGAELTQKLLNFVVSDKKIEEKLDEYSDELKSQGYKQPEFGELYKHFYDKIYPERLLLYKNTISNNPNGVGEIAVMHLCHILELKPNEWDSIHIQMPDYLKDRAITKRNDDKFTNLKRSLPGQPFIDFKGKTIDDKEVMLSDYVGRGKYVLLDFWASWCSPCRELAKRVIYPLYEKYKDDDRFMILGIATWEEKEATLKGLEKLQYPWQQILDTKQIPLQLYGFDGIPHLLLIDPDGIIIERSDLRGSNLLETIDSVLSSKDSK